MAREHSPTVQAFAAIAGVILTLALAITTIVYAITTHRILAESRKATLAAELQAKAQQDANELLKSQQREQLRLDSAAVTLAIAETRQLLTYWSAQMTRDDFSTEPLPDISQLDELPISDVLDTARRLSLSCAQFLVLTRSNVTRARAEIERYRQARAVSYMTPSPAEAVTALDRGIKLLDEASKAVVRSDELYFQAYQPARPA